MSVKGSMTINDGRFENKTKKMINKIIFPVELGKRVNMQKINFKTFKYWISEKIQNILGIEDEILVDMIFNELEKQQYPDPRVIYIQLIPFLERHVRKFMVDLWVLLISAQKNSIGVPQEIINKAKEENKRKHMEENRYSKILKKRYLNNEEKRKKKRKLFQKKTIHNYTKSKDCKDTFYKFQKNEKLSKIKQCVSPSPPLAIYNKKIVTRDILRSISNENSIESETL